MLDGRNPTFHTTMDQLINLLVCETGTAQEAMFANPPLVVFLVIFIILGSFGSSAEKANRSQSGVFKLPSPMIDSSVDQKQRKHEKS